MDAGTIVVNSIGVAATVAAAIFAWVQASAAVRSRNDAQQAQSDAEHAKDEALELSRKATAAAERQAEAQEEANRLEFEGRAPKAWSGPNYVSESVRSWINSSGRTMIILGYAVLPEGESKFIRLHDHQKVPFEIPERGQLRLMKIRASGARPDVVVVRWKYKDDSEEYEANIPVTH